MEFEFRVKIRTALDFKVLSRIGDLAGYDLAYNSYIYRFNPLKASSLSRRELEEILEKYKVYPPREVLEEVESLKSVDVYFNLRNVEIEVLSKNSNYLKQLTSMGLARRVDERYFSSPSHFHLLTGLAEELGLKWKTSFKLEYNLSLELKPNYKLRDYQLEAYEKWKSVKRGVIVLPVAAGKTLIGIHAINDLKLKTLIVVPTLDLQNQWIEKLQEYLGVEREEIGVYGGGKREHKQLTVITYDSASQSVEGYVAKYGLIIADECHHAVSQSYSRAFTYTTAPYKLGLTATPYRSDALHKLYPKILGPIVYKLNPEDLREKGYLADYEVRRVYVKLSQDEYREYKELMKKYLDYCRENFPGVKSAKERFKEALRRAGKSREAREALRARHEAKKIALNAEKKLEKLEELLEELRGHKIIIFSRYSDLVREVSKRLLIPKILHDTPKDERKLILKMFRRGEVKILASAMALDEGVDVPDASAAIILSGTSSHREYVQRLGRILRPKEGRAVLVELVTEKTVEPSIAKRRKRPYIFEDKTVSHS